MGFSASAIFRKGSDMLMVDNIGGRVLYELEMLILSKINV